MNKLTTMESNLQHEDLLIRLRGKLNEEKIKLWEPPYLGTDNIMSQSLKDLATKYVAEMSLDLDEVTAALRELQLHSMDRVKANDQFKETGLATFRIKVTLPKQKPIMLKIQKTLDVLGSELINSIASEVGVEQFRVKLISNGKIVMSHLKLGEQKIKNGSMLMALVLEMTPDEMKKEDAMFLEMKTTKDDAMLLSDFVNEPTDDDEYIKLEDQSGKAVDLPPAERKLMLVGLALHERGRAAIKQKDYSLALMLLLEADSHFNDCRSSLLQVVDNWGILQLDIAWCYAGLRSVGAAADAAMRLDAAERALKNSYGNDHKRLLEVKGSAANERVLLMRLYLLQGIVAYHQNKRAEARVLLEKAETELNSLRVDEKAMNLLMNLGWSRAQARLGLRGAAGNPEKAHLQLVARAEQRLQHRRDRQQRLLGVCADGSPVDVDALRALVRAGFARSLALLALRHCNNSMPDAKHVLNTQPELLGDVSGDSSSSDFTEDSSSEPDNKLVAELEAMGYSGEQVRSALRMCNNDLQAAAELLITGVTLHTDEDGANPSTSTGEAPRKKAKKEQRKRKERELALHRLSSAIRTEEDDYLDTSLLEEEQYLTEYKSLL